MQTKYQQNFVLKAPWGKNAICDTKLYKYNLLDIMHKTIFLRISHQWQLRWKTWFQRWGWLRRRWQCLLLHWASSEIQSSSSAFLSWCMVLLWCIQCGCRAMDRLSPFLSVDPISHSVLSSLQQKTVTDIRLFPWRSLAVFLAYFLCISQSPVLFLPITAWLWTLNTTSQITNSEIHTV